jgi:hypothetical protein
VKKCVHASFVCANERFLISQSQIIGDRAATDCYFSDEETAACVDEGLNFPSDFQGATKLTTLKHIVTASGTPSYLMFL